MYTGKLGTIEETKQKWLQTGYSTNKPEAVPRRTYVARDFGTKNPDQTIVQNNRTRTDGVG